MVWWLVLPRQFRYKRAITTWVVLERGILFKSHGKYVAVITDGMKVEEI